MVAINMLCLPFCLPPTLLSTTPLNIVHHSTSFTHYGLNIHLCMCFLFIRFVQETCETFTEQGLQVVEEVAAQHKKPCILECDEHNLGAGEGGKVDVSRQPPTKHSRA